MTILHTTRREIPADIRAQGVRTSCAPGTADELTDALANTERMASILRLANQLKATLAGIGTAVRSATSALSRQMSRNFTDQGVTR